jgi:hypothetical protein
LLIADSHNFGKVDVFAKLLSRMLPPHGVLQQKKAA